MPQRPPTIAQRLRSVWSHDSETKRSTGPAGSAPGRHAGSHKGSDFADRLRAAVSARH